MEKLINLKESSSKLRLENQLEEIRSKRNQDYIKRNIRNNKTCKTNNALPSAGIKKKQNQ